MKRIILFFDRYAFAAGIFCFLFLETLMEILRDPACWMELLILRGSIAAAVYLVWSLCWKRNLISDTLLFIDDYPILKLLIPMTILTGGIYFYHITLFPVCAVFWLVLSIFFYSWSTLHHALMSVALWTSIFAATSILAGQLSGAIVIIVGGAALLCSHFELVHWHTPRVGTKSERIMALLLLIVSLAFLAKLPPVQSGLQYALFQARGLRFDDTFPVAAYHDLGKTGIFAFSFTFCTILVFGWQLVIHDYRMVHSFGLVSMTTLTVWILVDYLKVFQLPMGSTPLAIGMSNLDILVWLTLACVILPPHRLIPHKREQHCGQTAGSEENKSNCRPSRFQKLLDALTSSDSDYDVAEKTAMWEEMWFDNVDDIPDDRWDELEAYFKEFSEKEGIFHHDP